MRKTTIQNLVLMCVSLLFAIFLAEVILRLFVPLRTVGPSFSEYNAIYGKTLRRNFSATRITPEFRMTFSTNSLGFRGPEPDAFPFRPIVFLGDSFTMGYGVNDGEEFPALIRRALERKYGLNAPPVINAGMGNNGNGRWLKFLRYEGRSYDPCCVVVQVLENDFKDNIKEQLFAISENGRLEEQDIPPISPVRRIQRFINGVPGLPYSYIIALGNYLRWLYEKRKEMQEQPFVDDRLTYRLLEEVINICRQEGWPLFAIVIGIHGSRLAELERRFTEAEIPILRLPDKQTRPDLYYTADGHWNAKGHAFAAELILRHGLNCFTPATK